MVEVKMELICERIECKNNINEGECKLNSIVIDGFGFCREKEVKDNHSQEIDELTNKEE